MSRSGFVRFLGLGACLIWTLGHAAESESVLAHGYKLQPGDVLQVVVWKETDLQSEVGDPAGRRYLLCAGG